MRHGGHIDGRFLAFGRRRGWLALLLALVVLSCLHGMAMESGATADSAPAEMVRPPYLEWVQQTLDVEQRRVLELLTNPAEDAFGAWYEGEGRKHVEQSVPGLAPVLEVMHAPLNRLRYALNQIAATHVDVDPELTPLLDRLEVGNLAWAARVHKAIVQRQSTINLDEHPFGLGTGRLIAGEVGRRAARADVVLEELLGMLQPVHQQLFETGQAIESSLAQEDDARAMDIYRERLVPLLRREQGFLNWFATRVREHQEAQMAAQHLMTTHVVPSLRQLQGLLAHVTQVSGNLILRQERTVAVGGIELDPWDHILVATRFSRFFPGLPPRNQKFLPHPDRVVILRGTGLAKI
ncbi:MAG: hypothetical protein HQL76_05580 [Magnetococcales bacterium]|nr:hypothetical protein [Magnetococcales bacterium]